MPLAQYQTTFWLPSGALAANTLVRVFPLLSNTFASLWTDGTGTVALPNPLLTNGAGTVTFWAEEGEYWLHINDEAYRVSVGSPNLDVFEAASTMLTTGVLSGGELNVNGANPKAVDIGATVGYVLDYQSTPPIPVMRRVSTAPQTVALDAAALLRVVTWWLMDANGTVIQQATRPTNSERRDYIVLGATGYDAGTGAIFTDQSLPVIVPQPMNQLADLMDAMGPFNITGNVITPNGANLSINRSAGSVFARAFNRFAGPVLTKDPHVTTTVAAPLSALRRLTRTPQFPLPAPFTTINPGQYDNAGVLSPVVANNATIQRVWFFPLNNPGDQLAVQYGQTQYADLNSALDRVGQGDFVVNPTTVGNAVLLAHIVVRGNATNLSDTTQCVIRRSGKLDYP